MRIHNRIKLTKGNSKVANEKKKHGKGRDEQQHRANGSRRDREGKTVTKAKTEKNTQNPIDLVWHIYLNGCRWKRLSWNKVIMGDSECTPFSNLLVFCLFFYILTIWYNLSSFLPIFLSFQFSQAWVQTFSFLGIDVSFFLFVCFFSSIPFLIRFVPNSQMLQPQKRHDIEFISTFYERISCVKDFINIWIISRIFIRILIQKKNKFFLSFLICLFLIYIEMIIVSFKSSISIF